ncbi:alpha/beta fold hydrolase [Salisediminibacterium selenitireducens]|uniref:Alpha/beta hydrolase fold protein n=1 Tax=Bacillus selenitireducens (strain ATCC 700615 / DSM 15326 / MLS10) TaxID=439292 RepID=D6XWJ8_BACIE|nr:alpha/beta hydrolase [Salisediminibacterium selenitireducens]ADH97840.1 alpha/beta hydrolase fold protein [[Bacillus] selenitireducens MLS10]
MNGVDKQVPRWKTWLIRSGLILAGLLVVFMILPFLIPVSEQDGFAQDTPFEDSAFAEVDGVWLHYRISEPEEAEEAETVLFVHGLGGSTYSWRYQVEPFTEAGYRVIRVDLPVFGYSDRQRGLEHSMANRSMWLWGLLDELETEEVHLAGHSMGGGVITQMALDEPERIRSLIYVAGAVYNEPRSSFILDFPPVQRGIEVIAPRIAFTEARIRGILDSAYGQPVNDELVHAYLDTFNVQGTPGAWVDLLRSTTSVDTERLHELGHPALLLWGEDDSWVSVQEGEMLRDALPNASMAVLEGSGHMPMETDYPWFNDHVIAFLDELVVDE